MSKLYVVSGDIDLKVNGWAEQKGFKRVPDWVFKGMREEFSGWMRQMFKGSFELVPWDGILYGRESLVEDCGLSTISLDGFCYCDGQVFDITRWVDEAGNDCGLGHRKNVPLDEQLRVLSETSPKEVALVDDVIYTGSHVEKVIDLLSRHGICVRVVIAGIGIGQGIQRVKDLNVEVRCVRTYPEVIDEVCERDFYPGVSMSGRSLVGGGNIGAPYLLPFGNPTKWASIPQYFASDFSLRCIRLAKDLFHYIGRSSDPVRPIRCCDLSRGIVGLPKDETEVEHCLGHIQHKLAAGFESGPLDMEMHNC